MEKSKELSYYHLPRQRHRRTIVVWCHSSHTWSSCDGRTSPLHSASPSRTHAFDRRSKRRCLQGWQGTLFWESPVRKWAFSQSWEEKREKYGRGEAKVHLRFSKHYHATNSPGHCQCVLSIELFYNIITTSQQVKGYLWLGTRTYSKKLIIHHCTKYLQTQG